MYVSRRWSSPAPRELLQTVRNAALSTLVSRNSNSGQQLLLPAQASYPGSKKRPGRLDVLINNAGGGVDAKLLHGDMSLRECFNKAYDLNVSGTNLMMWTFTPLLLMSAELRLIFLAGLS
ncbi:hypothetical protein HBI17_203420 [Parastagonospora nodorum]|nr:hypothetical protein HBI17_203420 [Parastagonospora nodorum]